MKIAIVTWASSGLWKIFVDNLIKEKDLDQIRVLARSKDKLNELKTQYWDKIVPYTIDLSVHDEIIKFSKHEWSGLAWVPSQLKNLCKWAEVLEWLAIRGSAVYQAKEIVENWL